MGARLRISQLDDAHVELELRVRQRFGVVFAPEEWWALRTPQSIVAALAERGALAGDETAPDRAGIEQRVREAARARLGMELPPDGSRQRSTRLFRGRLRAWDEFCAELGYGPWHVLSPWFRISATILPCAVLVGLLGWRLYRGAEHSEVTIAGAMCAAAATAVVCCALAFGPLRRRVRRGVPALSLENVVDFLVIREIEARSGAGALSAEQALAWLEATWRSCCAA
jgi:hypothetical protein